MAKVKPRKKKLEGRSKRIIVRPYRSSDYMAWRDAFLSAYPRKLNEWDIEPRSKNELKKSDFTALLKSHKKDRENDTFYNFGMFLKDGTLVGAVSLMDISRKMFQNAYLGYRVLNQHWGKGYGKEGIKLAIDIAFKQLGLHRIEAGIEPRNKRSIALAKSAGLRREGFSKRRLILRGKWLDMYLFAMTSEERGVRWRAEK